MRSRPVALSTLALTALLAACGGAEPTASLGAARQTTLTVAPGSNTLVTGLGGPAGYGEIDLTATTSSPVAPVTSFTGNLDDGAWALDLSTVFPDGITLGGRAHSAIAYVSTNGAITLDAPNPMWAQSGVAGSVLPMFAGLAADVDLSSGGKLYAHLDPSPNDPVATFTWLHVAPYGGGSGTNSFQIRLHRTSTATTGDAVGVELRYAELGWTTTASTSWQQGIGGWSDGNTGTTGPVANLLPDTVGTTRSTNDNWAITYGTQFSASADGVITGLRWYGDASVGTRAGRLYAGWKPLDQKVLLLGDTASVAPAGGTQSLAWHSIPFTKPIPITRGQHYTVALLADQAAAQTSVAVSLFFASAWTNGTLSAPADAGKYALGDAFPDQGFGDHPSYLIDVEYQQSGTGGAHADIAFSGTSDVVKNATGDASTTNLVPPQAGVYLFNAPDVPVALLTATDASPQSATVNTAFGKPVSVTVNDAYGHPVQGVTVTFAAPALGAGAALSAATAVTDAQGVASVTATANGTAGTYTVVATAGSATGSFQLTNADSSGGSGPKSSGGCGTGGDASAGLFLPALSALVLRLRRRR